jgi:hypothetical protein
MVIFLLHDGAIARYGAVSKVQCRIDLEQALRSGVKLT